MAGIADYTKISVYGTSLVSDNLGNTWGGGAGISLDISPFITAGITGYFTMMAEKRSSGGMAYDFDYAHSAVLGGLSIQMPVEMLNDNRMRIWASLYGGYLEASVSAEGILGSATVSGGGMTIRPGLEFEYLYSQHIIPFAECGWFLMQGEDELAEKMMTGFQFSLGVKYCPGSTHRIFDSY